MDDKDLLIEYFNNQRYLKLINFSGTLMKISAGIWIWFIPNIMIENGYTPSITIVLGVLILGLVSYYSWYTIDQNSTWIDHIIGLLIFGLLIFQFILDIDTIFSIFIFTYGVIISNFTHPILLDFSRTQNMVTHGKGTPIILNTIRHSNSYLKEQISWNVKTLGIIGGMGLISLTGIKLVQILTIFFFAPILQLVSNVAFIILLLVVVYFGFPSIKGK